MIDIEFETPAQVDKLANVAVEKIQGAESRVLMIAFLFANQRIWDALKSKIEEGTEVTLFTPPITSYSGLAFPKAFPIYHEAAKLASERQGFKFYVCPLWWQKNRSLVYLRSLMNVPYTLHAKLFVVDDTIFMPSSNFESARHYDTCLLSDNHDYVSEAFAFAEHLRDYSVDIESTAHNTAREMVSEATKMTILSKVEEQREYPFRHLIFFAPFYKYNPSSYIRQKLVQLPSQSEEYIDVMFQHFMPDVKDWSEPSSPSIIDSVISKHAEGVDVRILSARGVSSPTAVRAETAPILKSLIDSNRIRKSTKVHAKFLYTEKGFLVGSMNINPSSLFYGHLEKRMVDVNAALHLLLPEAFPEELVEAKYGTISEAAGYKSSVEILLIQEWNEENMQIKDKLRSFFNQTWSKVG
jgi:phosphatidylserine/phosphatidylglycerophosphate/cardiolipin synthase-like enzyme